MDVRKRIKLYFLFRYLYNNFFTPLSLLITILIAAVAGVVGSDVVHFTTNCYIKYLKNANKLESNFPEYPGDVKERTCEETTSKFKTRLNDDYPQIVNYLVADNEIQLCIIEGLKSNDDFFNAILQRTVYKSAKSLLPEGEVAKLEVKAEAETTKILSKHAASCIKVPV